MTSNLEKLRALLPALEAWTGGERRDLDAKIAEAFGIYGLCKSTVTGAWFVEHHAGGFEPVPRYLGTDPAIATEDAQRLVMECGLKWIRNGNTQNSEYLYSVFDNDMYYEEEGHYLMLALVRALIEMGEKK